MRLQFLQTALFWALLIWCAVLSLQVNMVNSRQRDNFWHSETNIQQLYETQNSIMRSAERDQNLNHWAILTLASNMAYFSFELRKVKHD